MSVESFVSADPLVSAESFVSADPLVSAATLVGVSLLAKRPVQPPHIQRLKYSLREQARSHEESVHMSILASDTKTRAMSAQPHIRG